MKTASTVSRSFTQAARIRVLWGRGDLHRPARHGRSRRYRSRAEQHRCRRPRRPAAEAETSDHGGPATSRRCPVWVRSPTQTTVRLRQALRTALAAAARCTEYRVGGRNAYLTRSRLRICREPGANDSPGEGHDIAVLARDRGVPTLSQGLLLLKVADDPQQCGDGIGVAEIATILVGLRHATVTHASELVDHLL